MRSDLAEKQQEPNSLASGDCLIYDDDPAMWAAPLQIFEVEFQEVAPIASYEGEAVARGERKVFVIGPAARSNVIRTDDGQISGHCLSDEVGMPVSSSR